MSDRHGLAHLVRAVQLASFAGPAVPDWLLDEVAAGLGGVCLFAANVPDADTAAANVSALRAARADVLVAIDEEGGDVTRLERATGSSEPGPAALGAADDLAATTASYKAIGRRLAALGIDVDLAPSADVNVTAANPVIGVRSFGADPDLVARHVAAAVDGLHAAGVAACPKHFPGHGATTTDSHHALAHVDADRMTLDTRELVPYRSTKAAIVMTAHVVATSLDSASPAPHSRAVLAVLRDDLGFDGVILTDALDMAGVHGAGVAHDDVTPAMIGAGAVAALAAGCDFLCLGSAQGADVPAAVAEAITAAVESGDLSYDRLADAARRIDGLRDTVATVRANGDATGDEPADDAARAAAVADRARRIVGAPLGDLAAAIVVDCRNAASMANYDVAWGLGVDVVELDPAATAIDALATTTADELLAAASGRPLVVTVRGAPARRWQRNLVDDLAAARPDLVVVELGWPDDPVAGASSAAATTITTYGASRAITRATARYLLDPTR